MRESDSNVHGDDRAVRKLGIEAIRKALKANERKERAKNEKEAKFKKEKEKELEEKWSQGAKDQSKKLEQEKKKKEIAIKKAEREKLLSEEVSVIKSLRRSPDVKSKNQVRGSAKKALEKGMKVDALSETITLQNEVQEYAAVGIDDALNLLSLTEHKGGQLEKLERHSERRMKSAWNAFEEREMPLIKAERPGLRLSQYKQLLQKKWKKSEDNPINQVNVSYDTSREEEQLIADKRRRMMLEDMCTKK